MNHTAEVYLWGTRIGIIHKEPEKNHTSFEFDESFLKSGIEVSPLRMPLSRNVYEFPSLAGEPFYGMPGLVADSLPDSFGNAVIEQWLLSKGRSLSDFTAIDRLCYTGQRGMGHWNLYHQVGSLAGGARAKALIAWNEKTNEVRSMLLPISG